MLLRLLIFLLIFLPSCGKMEHKASGTVYVDGTIIVKHEFSLDEIQKFFRNECLSENPNYSSEQLDTCTNDKISNFVGFFRGNSSGN